jgi:hypothetical protein
MKHLGTYFNHRDLPTRTELHNDEGLFYRLDLEQPFIGPFSTQERMEQDMIIRTAVLPDLKPAWHGLRGHKMAAIKIHLNGETTEMVIGIPVNKKDEYHRVDVSVRSVHQYFEGGLAQTVWPKICVDDREFLISGIYMDNSEWEAMFASDSDTIFKGKEGNGSDT